MSVQRDLKGPAGHIGRRGFFPPARDAGAGRRIE